MAKLNAEQIGQLVGITSVYDFKAFLNDTLGINITNDIVLATIANEFNLGELRYEYVEDAQNLEHKFLWDSKIEVPPGVNDDQFVENVFFSFRIVPAEQPTAGETDVIGVEHLLYDTFFLDNAYLWSTITPFVADATLTDEPAKRDRISETIATNSGRDDLLTALGFDTSQVNIDPAIAESFIFAPQVS